MDKPPFPPGGEPVGLRPGLIWGYDFTADGSVAVEQCDDARPGVLRWLHLSAIAESIGRISRALSADVQRAEDAFLSDRQAPTSRDLIAIRHRLTQSHRLLGGMWEVFKRLEEDEELPEPLRPTLEKLSQRLQSLDSDIMGVTAQVRLLRESGVGGRSHCGVSVPSMPAPSVTPL